jgi:hypothetical protein
LGFNDAQCWSLALSVIVVIPLLAVKPAHEVQAMLAAIVLEITVNKLRLHRVIQLSIPTPLDLNNDCNRVRHLLVRFPHNCIHVDIRPLSLTRAVAAANFDLAIHDDPALFEILIEAYLDVIRKGIFIFGMPGIGVNPVPKKLCGRRLPLQPGLQPSERFNEYFKELAPTLNQP